MQLLVELEAQFPTHMGMFLIKGIANLAKYY
jgi:hypothetical protein